MLPHRVREPEDEAEERPEASALPAGRLRLHRAYAPFSPRVVRELRIMYNFFLQHRTIVVYGRVVLDDLDVRHGRGSEERDVGPVSDVAVSRFSPGDHRLDASLFAIDGRYGLTSADSTTHHAADDDEH